MQKFYIQQIKMYLDSKGGEYELVLLWKQLKSLSSFSKAQHTQKSETRKSWWNLNLNILNYSYNKVSSVKHFDTILSIFI